MQEQMNVLSQAILQINHNLSLINQSIALRTEHQVPLSQDAHSRTLVQNMMPKLTTKSLSISELSNQLVL